jgi:hypothetical protein
MRRGLEAGYGSPQNPEVVGMAQQALSEAGEYPLDAVVRQDGSVLVGQNANSLEGKMYTPVYATATKDKTREQSLLDSFKEALPNTAVDKLEEVVDTGFLPLGKGVELGFQTKTGEYFTSVAPTVEQAMTDGVAYSLLDRE